MHSEPGPRPIVDTNFSVGTIFGVWPGNQIVGTTGRDLAAAGIVVYGPRTVFCVAFKGVPGTFDFVLQDDGKWHLAKETTKIGEGKLFAPGNLRCTLDNPEYLRLISYYNNEQYTLRYTGGMVPDVYQMFIKGRGVFTNVMPRHRLGCGHGHQWIHPNCNPNVPPFSTFCLVSLGLSI